MNTVSYSKCQKCNNKQHISELKENPDGIGMVCIDNKACVKHQKNKKVVNP